MKSVKDWKTRAVHVLSLAHNHHRSNYTRPCSLVAHIHTHGDRARVPLTTVAPLGDLNPIGKHVNFLNLLQFLPRKRGVATSEPNNLISKQPNVVWWFVLVVYCSR